MRRWLSASNASSSSFPCSLFWDFQLLEKITAASLSGCFFLQIFKGLFFLASETCLHCSLLSCLPFLLFLPIARHLFPTELSHRSWTFFTGEFQTSWSFFSNIQTSPITLGGETFHRALFYLHHNITPVNCQNISHPILLRVEALCLTKAYRSSFPAGVFPATGDPAAPTCRALLSPQDQTHTVYNTQTHILPTLCTHTHIYITCNSHTR